MAVQQARERRLTVKEVEEWKYRHGISDFVFCDSNGCIMLEYDCVFDHEYGFERCTKEIVTFGIADSAIRQVLEVMDKLDALLENAEKIRNEFIAGKVALSDAINAWTKYHNYKKKVVKMMDDSNKVLKQALGAVEDDDEHDACKRLVEAINDVVDHPEG